MEGYVTSFVLRSLLRMIKDSGLVFVLFCHYIHPFNRLRNLFPCRLVSDDGQKNISSTQFLPKYKNLLILYNFLPIKHDVFLTHFEFKITDIYLK